VQDIVRKSKGQSLEAQAKMATKKHSSKLPQSLPDDPQYVEKWACELVAAIGKRKARAILEDYRALAEDKKIAGRDRAVSAQRVEILEKLLVTR